MEEFVHLHVHSEYSLLDGACRIKQLVARVKELGQTACAVTDHGNMFAAVEFYDECKAQGIKPIIGCEVYVAPRTRFDKIPKIDAPPYHLVLLCENNTGYRNLIKMVSMGYTEGFYSRPRIDIELLEKYHEGLICLSACLAGEIPRKLSNNDYNGALETALKYKKIFGENNYFIEIQNHKFIEQERIIPQLIRLSKETDIPLVATNDAHYLSKSDAYAQKILMCISTATTVDEPSKMEFPTEEFYIKSQAEMAELFPSQPQAITNTGKIAARCNVDFEFGKTKLPYFHIDGVDDNEKFLRDMCRNGLYERYVNPTREAFERLEYELSVITQMGYTDYYLIVWDFIRYAKSQKIPVGCGRGSGAGSLCAYCIGITGIDPLKYNLLFERFLNPERVSMPDFDIDFCMEGRQKVIDYVVNKYGSDHVAQIVTFGTLAAKAAVRDVARAMGLPYQTGDIVSKAIPRGSDLRYAIEQVPEVSRLYKEDEKIHSLLDTAVKVEGMPRNVSTHAAGVVITKEPVDSYVPLYARDGQVSTQYTMTVLERLGLLKIDFLGLRNLTIINHCQLEVRKKIPDFDIENIPIDDCEVYSMLSQGKTEGVFQFESAGMTATIMKLRPTGIEDLIAVISLYRPGPMDSIPTYIRNRHNPYLVKYKHPLLKETLEVTYGCIVYQEQVMQIFRTLAGYSYGRADIVRRAMAKKKHEVLENERKAFIYGEKNQCEGCIARGVPEKTANEIFDEMISFASYAFNKSHAAAYATIAYQTAYLKCHHYKEYMAALMTITLLESTEKLNGYVADCARNGVKILPIDINKSEAGFIAEKDGIRFAMKAVKSLGEGAISSIVKERTQGGAFHSLQDFCFRMCGKEITVKGVEQLIKSGAMDFFPNNRHEMINAYEELMQTAGQQMKSNLEGQLDFFGNGSTESAEKKLEPCGEFPQNVLLEFEREAVGMYMSGHPLDDYTALAMAAKCCDIADLFKNVSEQVKGFNDGDTVSVIVMQTHMKRLKTKKGSLMCFADCEDKTSAVEVVVFPNLYQVYSSLLNNGTILHITGKISVKEDENPKIIADLIETAERFSEQALKRNVCVRVNSFDRPILDEIKRLACENADTNGVMFRIYFADINKTTAIKMAPSVRLDRKLIADLQTAAGDKNVLLM